MKTGTHKIRWTDDERDLVTERMAELFRARPRILKKALWIEAQDVLDVDRRRPFFPVVTSKERPMLLEAQRRAHAGPVKVVQPVEPPEPSVVYVPVPTPTPMQDIPLRELVTELFMRLEARWSAGTPVSGTPAPAASVLPASGRPLPAPAGVVDRERPVRIGVCGLLPAQFNHVKERVNGTKVELVLVSNQTNPTRADWPQSLDYAICTRFIRHGHEEHARAVYGRERVAYLHSTGIEAVVEQVERWVAGARN